MHQLHSVAVAIFNDIVDGEGGTLDLLGHELPTHGYFVGGASKVLIFHSPETANNSAALKHIETFVKDLEGRYVGWWADEETGKVYVDATDWYPDYETAEKECRRRGEIAFYSIADQRGFRPVVSPPVNRTRSLDCDESYLTTGE